MTVPTAPTGLAFDSRGLEALRRQSGADPKAAVREAAGQFEALFMQQLLKSMRAAIPRSGLFEGPGHDTYTSMLDSQLSQQLGRTPGGLADLIAKQMSRHLAEPAAAAVGTAGTAANPAAAERSTGGLPVRGQGGLPVPGAVPSTLPVGVPTGGAARGDEGMPPGVAAAQRTIASTPAAAGPERLAPEQVAFVEAMWPHALAAQQSSGVPAAFVVGQAALESGWGRRDIRGPQGEPSHNLFGIKATGQWSGRSVPVLTTEYVDGEPRKVVEKFRAYDSYTDAFADWSRLIGNNSRYAAVLSAETPGDFARRLEAAGYATDPRYGEKLEKTINLAMRIRRAAP